MAATKKKPSAQRFQNRIVGSGTIDPTQLMANPGNWRVHPTHQRHALKDVLDQVGWAQMVVVNKTTGHLIDGHLRADLAVEEGEKEIPYVEVELTEDEERLILATLDPLSALAITDSEKLGQLMSDLEVDGDVLKGFLDDLEQANASHGDDTALGTPDPSDFWPRVAFRLPPNLYSTWRDRFEAMDGDQDHEKIEAFLGLLDASMPAHSAD